MLSIATIGALPKNKQNSPNFKGSYHVTGNLADEAYKEYAEFQKGLVHFVQKHQSRLIDNDPFANSFHVTCEKVLNNTILGKLNNLAEKFKLKVVASDIDPYKADPKFDLDKVETF